VGPYCVLIPLSLLSSVAGASILGDLSVCYVVGVPLRQSGSRFDFGVFCVIGLVFQSACVVTIYSSILGFLFFLRLAVALSFLGVHSLIHLLIALSWSFSES